MSLIQITRHKPPAVTEEELHDVTRTIRYRYEPKPGDEAEFAAWLQEAKSREALALIERHPEAFTPHEPIRHPLQELFCHPPTGSPLVRSIGVAIAPRVIQLILQNQPHVASSSGGKDGSAADLASDEVLDWIGHAGPRAVGFSDVGRLLDWADSRDSVTRLAEMSRRDLIIVEMPHSMMQQWERRWQRGIERYAALKCVKLIKPFSTPDRKGRFCSASKIAPLTQEIPRRYPDMTILSATGVRREESSDRLFASVCSPSTDLLRVKLRTQGFETCPIVHWREEHVRAYLRARGFRLPNSYSKYEFDRHSCMLCVCQGREASRRAVACPEAHPALFAIVDLEIVSTYTFYPGRFLADEAAAQGLLDAERLDALAEAKERARTRILLESQIPPDLLYTDHWPTREPTPEEAELLAKIRRGVAEQARIEVGFTDGPSIIERFRELLDEKAAREARKAALEARRQAKEPTPQAEPQAQPEPKKKRRLPQRLDAPPQSQLSLLDGLGA